MILSSFDEQSRHQGRLAWTALPLPPIAALAGSVVGGLTSLSATWISQSVQHGSSKHATEKARRQELYKMFIEEASTRSPPIRRKFPR